MYPILIRRNESMTRKEGLRRLRRRESGIRWLLKCRKQRLHRAGMKVLTPVPKIQIHVLILFISC